MKPNEPEDVRAPRLKDRIAELLRLASSNEDGPSEDQVFGAVKALLNAVEPKSQPEDVQLDVEELAKWRHDNLGCPAHKGNGENSLICKEWTDKDVVTFVEQLALLRRVSGKGAQKVSHPGWCPCGNMEHMVPVGTSYEAAPVPATPDVEMIIARLVANWQATEDYSATHLARDAYKAGQSSVIPATTQGTPEGAK